MTFNKESQKTQLKKDSVQYKDYNPYLKKIKIQFNIKTNLIDKRHNLRMDKKW